MNRRSFILTMAAAAALPHRRGSFLGPNVTLVPFHRLFDERYAVYWKVTI